MPSSYSQSSTSEPSLDDECWREDANFGVPDRCSCGKFMTLEVSTTEENRGKKYYKCPNSEDGRAHIHKWWDEAIEEELKKINITFEDHKDRIQRAYQYAGGNIARLESMCESMHHMRVEIDKLKERLDQKDGEIARLRALLAEW